MVALRRVLAAVHRTDRRTARVRHLARRIPIVRLGRAPVHALRRTAWARVLLLRAQATTGPLAATARTSRNRARARRATTAIVRRTRTVGAARMSRHLAPTAIARHPPIPMAIAPTSRPPARTPRQAAAIRRRLARTRRPRGRIRLPRAPTLRLHSPTPHLLAPTPHQAVALAVVAGAGVITVAAVVAAPTVAVETTAADRAAGVAVRAATTLTATDSRCDFQGPLRPRSGPFALYESQFMQRRDLRPSQLFLFASV